MQMHIDSRLRLGGRYVVVLVRLYLGAWMLINGLNHFVPIFPQPMGGPDRSSQFMVTLIETGLLGVVKSTEIVVGIMLLFDLFVTAALIVAMPISVVVWYNHAVLVGRPFDFSMGIGCLLWNVLLLVAYLPSLAPLLHARVEIASLNDFKRIGAGTLLRLNVAMSPESRHRTAVALTGIALTGVLAYHLHPEGTPDAGAGLTPTMIVKAYLTLAYAEGKPVEAARMYVAPELMTRDAALADMQEGRTGSDQILDLVAQGSHVAVHQRIAGPSGESYQEVVDFYGIKRNRIAEHLRVGR